MQRHNNNYSNKKTRHTSSPPEHPLYSLLNGSLNKKKSFGIIDFGITGISSKKMKEYWHDMCNKEPKYFSRPGKGLGKHPMWIHINSEWSVVDENSSDFGW